MSSVVGHAAAGIASFLAINAQKSKRAPAVLCVSVFLAICADFDYLAIWFCGYTLTPRVTHSFAFALVMSTTVFAATRIHDKDQSNISFTALFIASLSHPMLDLFVGAHSVPLLWPLPYADVSAPGILPSAGTLSISNYFLWRNLFIEMGVLLPAFGLLIALARRIAWRTILSRMLILVPIWLLFVIWSVGLKR